MLFIFSFKYNEIKDFNIFHKFFDSFLPSMPASVGIDFSYNFLTYHSRVLCLKKQVSFRHTSRSYSGRYSLHISSTPFPLFVGTNQPGLDTCWRYEESSPCTVHSSSCSPRHFFCSWPSLLFIWIG